MNFAIIKADSDYSNLECDLVEELFINYFNFFDNQLTFFAAQKQELPDPNKYDAYFISGSRFSAYDNYDWIVNFRNYLRINKFKKLIGICFGHQIIAEARGGLVKRGNWHIGVHSINPISNYNLPFNTVRFNHQDHIEILPKDAIWLATSEICRYAMYQCGQEVLACQFHPEFDLNYHERVLARLIANKRISLAEEKEAQAKMQLACQAEKGFKIVIKEFLGC